MKSSELNKFYTPVNTEEVIFSHGFSFMKEYPCVEDITKLQSLLNTSAEICTSRVEDIKSNKKLGDVGVYIKGHVILMANRDMESTINEDGSRDIPAYIAEKDIFCSDYNELNTNKYCEIILQPTEIVGFWIRKDPLIMDEEEITEFEKEIKEIGTITYI